MGPDWTKVTHTFSSRLMTQRPLPLVGVLVSAAEPWLWSKAEWGGTLSESEHQPLFTGGCSPVSSHQPLPRPSQGRGPLKAPIIRTHTWRFGPQNAGDKYLDLSRGSFLRYTIPRTVGVSRALSGLRGRKRKIMQPLVIESPDSSCIFWV